MFEKNKKEKQEDLKRKEEVQCHYETDPVAKKLFSEILPDKTPEDV